MDSRIRLKMGDIEIEYEGSEDFVKSELLSLVSQVASLYRESGLGAASMEASATGERDSTAEPRISLTTGAIASKLGVKTGSDLAIAAAAHLTLVKGVSPFTRDQLRDEMKTAKSHYRKSYSGNLSRYLETLLRADVLVESAEDTYALTAHKKRDLEGTLAS